ncbi:MAG: Uma2 family endonuclease [Cyanobacteriota bacterium]|nr:Uma2 family endonuclease [Cyanobacteriota bacterium]
MTLAPPASTAPPASAAPPAPATGLVPLLLPPDLKLTPEQFALVCAANPEAVLELTAAGQVIAMTPTGGETGSRNNLLSARLQLWALGQGGWKVFDSSTGFRLPDGSVFSPDAAVVRLERWQTLTPEERRGFPPLCPDLVVELVSPSEEGPRGSEALRRKMAAYLANGARLGWLLFPEQRAVEIWRPGADPEAPAVMERIEPADGLEGGESLPGLRLELAEIWEG